MTTEVTTYGQTREKLEKTLQDQVNSLLQDVDNMVEAGATDDAIESTINDRLDTTKDALAPIVHKDQ